MDPLAPLYDEVIKILGAALGMLLSAVLVQVLRKLNLQLSAEQHARLETYTAEAIRFAEEWASQRLKANKPVNSAEKLEQAIAALVDRIPGITREEAIAIIHAQLPRVGTGAAAALSDLRKAATNEIR